MRSPKQGVGKSRRGVPGGAGSFFWRPGEVPYRVHRGATPAVLKQRAPSRSGPPGPVLRGPTGASGKSAGGGREAGAALGTYALLISNGMIS
jgi:hypothetical protein